MPDARKAKEQGFDWTPEDLAAVSDNPEWTADDFAKAKPARDVLAPEFLAGIKRYRGQRGEQKGPTKQLVSLRLDRDVVEKFKSDGPGWQSRINEALRKTLAE
jgi:uncharacterized protein (DUF4415 family)